MGAKMLPVIGLMSGTSLDGVDAAWLETDGERIGRTGPAITLPYSDALRADLRALLRWAGQTAPETVSARQAYPGLDSLTARLMQRHLDAIQALDRPAALIGLHGQTIWHAPQRRSTWQLADAAWLHRATFLPIAHDFRTADVAAGGQGAPLVPVFHAALAAGLPRPLAVLNLGGVANVTWIGANGIGADGIGADGIGADETIHALDTGPGNALLDDWVGRHTGARCDQDGALALAGRVDTKRLHQLCADPWFARPGPKSLDRDQFAGALDHVAALSAADGAATLVAFTAAAVALARFPAPPRRWLVTGGGRHNPAIMAALRARLAAPVDPVECVGWNGDALEAQCFAYLAARTRRGLPISFPTTTGAPKPLAGGHIFPAS